MGAAAAGIAAAGISAAGALGSSMMSGNGGSQSQSGTSQTAPWGPQQPYLEQGFQQAQGIYNNNSALGPYQGNTVAPGNQYEQNAINGANSYTQGMGSQIPGLSYNTAQALSGAAPGMMNAAGQIGQYAQGPNSGLMNTLNGYGTGAMTTQGASPGLSSALNASAIQGANALGGFQNDLQQVASEGLANPTQQIEQNAQSYANSPQVQQNIAATNAQIANTLNTQTLPMLNQGLSIGGNTNSSRAGMDVATAQGQAALAQGSADASIYNNAYNTGLGTASSLYSSGLNSAESASMFGYNDLANNANTVAGQQLGLNEFNTNTQLGAANSGLSQQLGYNEGNAGILGNQASLYGNAANLGLNAGTASQNQAALNYGLESGAGQLQQTAIDQPGLTNSLDQYLYNTTQPEQWEQAYMQSIQGNYGQTGSTTGTSSTTLPTTLPQGLTGLGQAALAGYSLYNNGSTQNGSLSYANPGTGTVASDPGLFSVGAPYSGSVDYGSF